MKYCQIAIACLLFLGFLLAVHWDFNGKPAKPPNGFSGFISSIVIYALLAWLYISAGAFSELLPK